MDLKLSQTELDAIVKEIEQQRCTRCLKLDSSTQPEFKIENGGLKKKLEKYIDFNAGGLKLLDLQIDGRPARFLLVPNVGKREIWLKFQYRF